MDFDYEYGGKVYHLSIKEDKNIFKVEIDGEDVPTEVLVFNAGFLKFSIGNRVHKSVVSKDKDVVNVFMDGMVYRLKEHKAGAPKPASKDEAEGTLNSPISGKVVKVLVKNGDVVTKDQELLIIEAMKMEHKVKAPYAGKVKTVNFKVDDQVDIGQLLVDVERAPEKPDAKAEAKEAKK
jgi:3-methylcrotonyl-CoA carboxylase alpha subunit